MSTTSRGAAIRPRRLLASAMALALALLMPAAAAAAPTWLAPQLLSAAGQDAFEPQLAIDPQGNALAIWERSDGTNARIEAAFRPAAGGAFGTSQLLSAAGQSANEPQLAIDPQGNALAVWERFDGATFRIEAGARPAGGIFGAPQLLSAAGQSAFVPQLAIDPQGNALAVWERSDGAKERIEAAFRPAGGDFGSPQLLSAAGQDAFSPQLAFDPQGNALAIWTRSDGTKQRIEAAFRPAGGAFGLPQVLSAAGQSASQPQIALDPQGNAVAIWERPDGSKFLIEAAFRPAGGAFGAPQLLSAPGQDARRPQLSLDAQGNALAVWERPDGAKERIEAAFRPAGGVFGSPQLLSAAGQDAFGPQVAFDPQGNALAVWEHSDGAKFRIEAAARPAGGTFGSPELLSAPGQSASHSQLATDPQGNALAVWERSDGAKTRIEAAGYDAAGPLLAGLSIPAAAVAGRPVAFSVSPSDSFSGVDATSWSFGDGAIASGAEATHAYAAAGTYQVRFTATDAVGNSNSAARTIRVEPAPNVEPALRIKGLALSPRRFPPVRGASSAPRARKGGGTTIRYLASRAARVRFSVERAATGRRVGRKCVRPAAGNHGRPPCTRFVRLRGGFGQQAKEGANRLRYSGRLRGRQLAPGRYRLLAVATAGGEHSKPARAGFEVVGR